jgi:PAN domain
MIKHLATLTICVMAAGFMPVDTRTPVYSIENDVILVQGRDNSIDSSGDNADNNQGIQCKSGAVCNFGGGNQNNRPTMQWTSNQWVDGDGNLGSSRVSPSQCAQMCVSNAQCQFVEYHKPTGKCNLFSHVPSMKPGNEADVAFKR